MVKKVFKIGGMHCASCAIDIDGTLEDTEGVKEACTNYAKQLTEVEYDENQIDETQIKKILGEAGYDANPAQN